MTDDAPPDAAPDDTDTTRAGARAGDEPGTDEPGDPELYRQAVSLLQPGDSTLVGVVVHTDFARAQEQPMNKLMREAGDRIAGHLADEEVYVYAGEDDERFGTGQFHGRRLDDDGVVWECQQLLREGTFDLVFYWETRGVHDDVLAALEGLGTGVVPVTEAGYGST